METYQDHEPGYESNLYSKLHPEVAIAEQCDRIKELLLAKNKAYGNSVFQRGKMFDMSPIEAIKARINDKVARIHNLGDDDIEDSLEDLTGYLILLKVAKRFS